MLTVRLVAILSATLALSKGCTVNLTMIAGDDLNDDVESITVTDAKNGEIFVCSNKATSLVSDVSGNSGNISRQRSAKSLVRQRDASGSEVSTTLSSGLQRTCRWTPGGCGEQNGREQATRAAAFTPFFHSSVKRMKSPFSLPSSL